MFDAAVLLGNTSDGVFAIEPGGVIHYWNDAAERILGYRADQVLGRHCREVFGGTDANGNPTCAAPCHIEVLVQRGHPVRHFTMATRTRTGEPIWLDVSTLHDPGAHDRAPCTVHLFRDVTSAHEIETLVRQKLAESNGAGPPGTRRGELTRRELEVIGLMRAGESTAAMASKLCISPATVRNHIQNIFAKLDVHSRLEVVAYAVRHRL